MLCWNGNLLRHVAEGERLAVTVLRTSPDDSDTRRSREPMYSTDWSDLPRTQDGISRALVARLTGTRLRSLEVWVRCVESARTPGAQSVDECQNAVPAVEAPTSDVEAQPGGPEEADGTQTPGQRRGEHREGGHDTRPVGRCPQHLLLVRRVDSNQVGFTTWAHVTEVEGVHPFRSDRRVVQHGLSAKGLRRDHAGLGQFMAGADDPDERAVGHGRH